MDDPKSANEVRMDMELVTRASFSSLQKEDDGRIISSDSFDEWTWSGLRVSERLITRKRTICLYRRMFKKSQLNEYFNELILLAPHS